MLFPALARYPCRSGRVLPMHVVIAPEGLGHVPGAFGATYACGDCSSVLKTVPT